MSCDDTFFVGEKVASERVTDMAVDSLGVVEKTAGAIAQASASGLEASEELASNIGSNVEKGVEGALLIGSLGGKQLVKKAAKAIAKAGKRSNLSKTTKSVKAATTAPRASTSSASATGTRSATSAKSKVSSGKQQMTLSEIEAKNVNNAASKTKPLLGKEGKQKRLKELADDQKLGRSDRGWLKQEINAINRKSRNAKGDVKKNIKNPPGKDLAHQRGREASKGYSYKHADLKTKADHKLQHKYDDYGRKNKERPIRR